MSKNPSIKSEYDAKKDRLEINIKHSGLKKKSERKDLMRDLEQNLKEGAEGVGKARGKARGKASKEPYKQTKIPEVGD